MTRPAPILREPVRGSIAVQRKWTDWGAAKARSAEMPPRQLAFESLLELAKLQPRGHSLGLNPRLTAII